RSGPDNGRMAGGTKVVRGKTVVWGDALASVPYSGPRPSKARRWAPWVVIGFALVSFGNAVQAVLNLVERGYQQDLAAGKHVDPSSVHDTVKTIQSVGRLTALAAFIAVPVFLVWVYKRRSRKLLRLGGEFATQPRLSVVWPRVYAPSVVCLV